jgi:uncharacterized repeat protein (TIGR01451 family)
MKNLSTTLFLLLACLSAATAQIVNIPDANFKNVLVNMWCVDNDNNGSYDSDVDTNDDGEIQVSEALAVTLLDVSSQNISDLTGIQSFTSLQMLYCNSNQITNLDLQGLTSLQVLECNINQIANLNVQGLSNLEVLVCNTNQLLSLNVQGLTSLYVLHCYNNQLTSLNVQNLTNLQALWCNNNQLTSLNLQQLTNLENLYCYNNLLTSLDVQGGLINLRELLCNSNELTSLNVQGLTNLQYLHCGYTQITSLDVLGLTNLQNLFCDGTHITSLDVLGLTNLQNLYCRGNQQLTSLNVLGLTSLQNLYCAGNEQLTSLNIQGLTNLRYLDCTYNQITNLDVQNSPNLQFLYCQNNPISCLPLLPQTLQYLSISNTNITCLPNIPSNLQTTLPLCTANNPQGCAFAARLYGKTYQDLNQNCTVEGTDIVQENLLVQAKNTATQEVYTTNSKADGFYELGLPTPATYEVKTVMYNNNYWSACPAQTVFLQADTTQVQRDMLIQPVVQCADVEVNHQLQNIARPCSTAVYKVSAFNAGTIAAAGIVATITLPTDLSFVSASRPFTSVGNGVYRVALPNLAALARDTFSFSATVSCAATMGQMLCTNVEILPNTYCIGGGLAGWDGSDIQLLGRCVGSDSIRFVLRNIGQGGMASVRNYAIVEDNIMIRGNAFQLAAGASDSTTVAADAHRIYRMIADEAPNNPAGNTQETFMVWGCSGANNQIHWGFVNQFGLNNGTSNPHQLCSQVRTSFDPNDIVGTPEGVGAQHFILKNTDLEYKIRFQNTGNDTAFVVRVLDKLPTELDASTLRIGTASHPFTWRLASNGVLEFLFQNILLPDSTTNEARSHGFVTYRIATKPNLSVGTTINNQAQIYFDVNAPVATNIYTHTIGENYASFLFSTPQIVDSQYFIKIFPNPMHDEATISYQHLEGVGNFENENTHFTLYNTLGQAVQQQTFAGQTLTLTRNDLPQGVYFYSITQQNRIIARGKLQVE